jgi:hypothetical protein
MPESIPHPHAHEHEQDELMDHPGPGVPEDHFVGNYETRAIDKWRVHDVRDGARLTCPSGADGLTASCGASRSGTSASPAPRATTADSTVASSSTECS